MTLTQLRRSSRLRLALLVATAITLTPSFASAQEKPTPTPPAAQTPPADPSAITIDFPGGPLSKFVALVAAKSPAGFSIMQQGNLDPVLPAFAVRNQYTNYIFGTLSALLEPQGYVLRSVSPTLAVLIIPGGETISVDFPGGPLSQLLAAINASRAKPLAIIGTADGIDPVIPAFVVRNERAEGVITALGQVLEPRGYALRAMSPTLAVLIRFNNDKTESGFFSFQLGAKLAHQSIDDIIAAIQAACEFTDPGDKSSSLRFKFHPGTKLLFVAGSHRQMEIARQVILSLPDGAPADPATPAPAKK